MSNFKELYCEILEEEGLSAYSALAPAFEELTERLLSFNAVTNITAITDTPEIIRRHYADCLLIAPLFPENATLLDVGCGGGFPTLPLAIARPDLRITSLDSTAKKLVFVDESAKGMGLSVKVLAGRAEELGKDPAFREQFDAVTARAVAALPILCEWCLPFVKKGGLFVAMKGSAGQEELSAAENAISLLGGALKEAKKEQIGGVTRYNLLIEKRASTPNRYPRAGGAIRKKPL
jgi:16S rRNA (guanine527-N7)-methyltransferase